MHVNRSSPPLTHTQHAFQCDMMSASTPLIKPEAAKCLAEMLGGHPSFFIIFNLNWPCDPHKSWGRNQENENNKKGPWRHHFPYNDDQMLLSSPFSSFKGDPGHKALRTLQSISQLAVRKAKSHSWLIKWGIWCGRSGVAIQEIGHWFFNRLTQQYIFFLPSLFLSCKRASLE